MMLFLCNSLMFMYLCLTTMGVVRSPYTISKYFEMVILYVSHIVVVVSLSHFYLQIIFIFILTQWSFSPRLLHYEYTEHITNIEHTYTFSNDNIELINFNDNYTRYNHTASIYLSFIFIFINLRLGDVVSIV